MSAGELRSQAAVPLDLPAVDLAAVRYTSPPRLSTFVRVSWSPAFEPSLLKIERTLCGCSPRVFAISATVAPRALRSSFRIGATAGCSA